MTDEAVEIPDVPEDVAETPDYQPNAAPCKLHTVSGKTFIVDDVYAWGYVPQGIFASGHWKDNPQQDRDIVIAVDRIDYIEVDYERLKRYIAQAKEEAS